MRTLRLTHALLSVLTILLVSCGGGGGGSSQPVPPPVVTPPAPGISLLTGSLGGPGNLDGAATLARFDSAEGVAVDAAGLIFVAERSGRIRKISPTGEVSTFAGSYLRNAVIDGTGTAASFFGPTALAFDGVGNLLVADGYAVRKVTPAGVVTTLAGSEQPGYVDGTGTGARFGLLTAITVDSAGNVFVADRDRFVIRKITPAGVVSTFAGKPGGHCDYQYTTPPCYAEDGTATTATFSWLGGLASDGKGGLYVADIAIRKVSPQGDVTTIAQQMGGRLALDRDGTLLVGQQDRIYRLSPTGVPTRLAGPDGNGPALPGLRYGQGIALDRDGNILVADQYDVGRVSPAGVVSVVAGNFGALGYAESWQSSAGLDAAGNLYMPGIHDQTVLKVTPAGSTTVLAGMPGQSGYADGPSATARFVSVHATTVDPAGNVYVADQTTIRKVTPAGVVSTVAGDIERAGREDGAGPAARLWAHGMTTDAAGNVYFTDGSTVRKMTPAGVVSTLAGHPTERGSLDGPASVARFSALAGIAIDKTGVIYVSDIDLHTIRRIGTDGTVSTLAGSAREAGSADGTGSAARFFRPGSLSLDEAGNLLVADTFNHTLRKVTPAGVVTTVAGQAGLVGVRTGPLPGSLSMPWFVVAAQNKRIYVRAEDGVLAIQLP